jgi:protein-tyrosine phosphatase
MSRSSMGDALVEATSAGLEAPSGRPMHPLSARALAELGGDPTGFTSSPFEAAVAVRADLVLTMTRRQRRVVLGKAPRGLRCTFTLREAAALATSADLTGLDELPVERRTRELAARLDAARRHRASVPGDDIADPITGRAAEHRAAAAAVAEALRPLVELLARTADEVAGTPVGARLSADCPG